MHVAVGKLVADSILTVRSAIRVASALRQLTPDALNRTTLLATAQLTTELDERRLGVNSKGVNKEWTTFGSTLQQNGVANWGVSRILDRFSVVDDAAAAAVR